MKLYGAINKVEPQNDGTIRVYGVASTETVDSDGEVVLASAMREALPDYMQFPALREMHQLSAAGTTLEAEVDDDDVTRIVAHVVDPIACKKVTEGVYRGFSIGGRALSRDPGNRKVITGLKLNEISLVDRPSCPDAVLDCWKADATPEQGDDTLSKENPTAGEGNEPTAEELAKAAADAAAVTAEAAEDHGGGTANAGTETVVEKTGAAATKTGIIEKTEAAAGTEESGVEKIENPDGETVEIDPELVKADESGEDDPIVKRKFTASDRRAAAKSGAAMKDGSYPIENKEDLQNAIRAVGRAKNRAAVIRHIKRRAKALGLESELPESMGGPKEPAKAEGHVPEQVWTCGDPSHNHIAKADAMRCVGEREALAKAAAAVKPAVDAVTELRAALSDALARAGKSAEEIAKLDGRNDLRKGLYTLSDLACMVLQLRSMVCNVDYEETSEHDEDSLLPQLMRDALKALVAAFRAMSDEETEELLDSVATNTAEPDMSSSFLYLAANANDIAKAGRRHSKTDMQAIQKAHDILKGLGAECMTDDADDMDDVAYADKVAKVEGEIAARDATIAQLKKAIDEVEPLTKAVSALGGIIDEMKKAHAEDLAKQAEEIAKLKAEPAAPKTAANLHAVDKAADGGAEETDEDLTKRLAEMSEEDRTLLLIKAARRNPVPVNFGRPAA